MSFSENTEGKGNGPDANEKPGYRPADLTQIVQHHGEKFPRQEIYDVIDGGKRLPGHYNFNSPMPLWGLGFQLSGKEYTEESEATVKRRINALVNYLESIPSPFWRHFNSNCALVPRFEVPRI